MEKLIVTKAATVDGTGGKRWAVIIDQEDKTHRIFKGVQLPDGRWRDLEDKVDGLITKIESQEIVNQGMKLYKEKVGQFWNVVDFEYVQDVFVKQAMEKVAEKPSGQEIGLWWKEIGEHIRGGTLKRKTSEGKIDLVGTAYITAYWAEAARVLGIKIE